MLWCYPVALRYGMDSSVEHHTVLADGHSPGGLGHQRLGGIVLGRWLIPQIAFKERFFLDATKEILQAVAMNPEVDKRVSRLLIDWWSSRINSD